MAIVSARPKLTINTVVATSSFFQSGHRRWSLVGLESVDFVIVGSLATVVSNARDACHQGRLRHRDWYQGVSSRVPGIHLGYYRCGAEIRTFLSAKGVITF